ncbi:hypothetical protein AC578_6675 [Pseudocercospora eumusae]|uniref:F-box domain-containing protein n=1 Tax=Pseudocercospora eumusae TaxID=321146 RepID=A0A139HI31_9PEZI|nr:hypothetical protein AC578_6675 [Pseudocercospora eumusae]
MDGTNASIPPNASLLLLRLPRELRNRIYIYLIPAALEVKVKNTLKTKKFEVTDRGHYVEAVATAPWKQLANVKLVCKQFRDELSEEISNAKSTKATGLLVDMQKAGDTHCATMLRAETLEIRRLDPAILEGFEEVTFAMPFFTSEHYPEPDDSFWSEKGIPYRSDYDCVGGYDFWRGRFKYTKHIDDQGANTWTLDAVEGDLLFDSEHIKFDYVEHELKLAAVKNQVDMKVVEKHHDSGPLVGVLSKLQWGFHLFQDTACMGQGFDFFGGIRIFNDLDQYEKEGFMPSRHAVLCGLQTRNNMPKKTNDAEWHGSMVEETYYL